MSLIIASIGTFAYFVHILQGSCAVSCKERSLCIDEVNVCKTEYVCRELVAHVTRFDTCSLLMVVSITIEVLYILTTARTLECTCLITFSVLGVIYETEEIETALVLPEIIVFVTYHHYGCVAAAVKVNEFPFSRTLERVCTESKHEVIGRTAPAAPEVTCLRETYHTEV